MDLKRKMDFSYVLEDVFSARKQENQNEGNRPMDLTTMPSAHLAFRLRGSLGCEKQVDAGRRGCQLILF
jgi:hypothetical protein